MNNDAGHDDQESMNTDAGHDDEDSKSTDAGHDDEDSKNTDAGHDDKASNLPALATNIGGNLPEVLQWPQHAILPASIQYAISMIVRAFPELNTESRIDMLCDLASFHGEPIDMEIARLVREFGVETVYNAIDWLYASGIRDRSGGRREDLFRTCGLLSRLSKCGVEVSSPEYLDDVVRALGGVTSAMQSDESDIRRALSRDVRDSD